MWEVHVPVYTAEGERKSEDLISQYGDFETALAVFVKSRRNLGQMSERGEIDGYTVKLVYEG